jgi:hypothetical protein
VTRKAQHNKSGEPTLPFDQAEKSRRKRKNVPVRPTPEELEVLHRRKASFGYKSLSKYLIERGLRDGEMIALVDERKVDRLLFEVRKIGVNLNQIARRLNEGKRSYSQEVIDRATRQVAEILRK